MSDSGIVKPEEIPIRNVHEYTTQTWRNWKRKHVYLVSTNNTLNPTLMQY